MAWELRRNPFSRDVADPKVEKNLNLTNLIASLWGVGTPASSKEDSAMQNMLLEYVREVTRTLGDSGWYIKGAFSYSGSFALNSFRMALSRVLVSGLPGTVVGSNLNSETESSIVLNAPPGSGTRNDLVYLEMWLAEVPGSTVSAPVSTNKPTTSTLYKYGNVQFGGTNIADDINEVDFEIRRRVQVQYRLRVVDGVDFATYPLGVDDPTVKAQGGAANPTAIQFSQDVRDSNLFLAGNGSVSHQGTLGSLDGLVYALPLCKVARTAGVTEITAPNVTDMRSNSGVLNFVKRDGDSMLGDLSIVATGSRTFLVQTTSNDSLAVLRAIGLTSGGAQVIGELIADNSGVVRLRTQSNHSMEFHTNNTLRMVLTAAGILQTAAGDPYYHKANMPKFTSSAQNIPSAGGTVSVAHSLGARPRQVWGVYRCITTDQGWAVNDEIDIGNVPVDGGGFLFADATNVSFKRSSTGTGPLILNKSTGASVNMAPANWNIVFYANP